MWLSQSAVSFFNSMTVERHLILQELVLSPSVEWIPRCQGWLLARVAGGTGYWLQHGAEARQLTVGDGLLALHNANGVVRASQLGPLKLQFFTVQPQFLNGLLTVTEWHQLEVAPRDTSAPVALFTASEPLGQKFTRLAEQSHTERLSMRCALLQLWASAIADRLSPLTPAAHGGNRLRDHFRELVGQMAEAELSACSLGDLSRQLHCSERHFSRLFREEFGVPFRSRQIELRLQRARQLLANSDAKIINVAYDSGYRHLGLFNAMFKKRFGLTPSEWRQQNLRKVPPSPGRNHLTRTATRAGVWFVLLGLSLFLPAFAQTNLPAGDTPAMARARAALFQKMAELDAQEKQAAHPQVASTNAGPKFDVEKYLVMGN
ncbi:MAG: helix-turn-helix transcriptional regulator, partial [Limisphaerales bacterium]